MFLLRKFFYQFFNVNVKSCLNHKLDFKQITFLVYFTMFLPKSAQSRIKAHNSKGNFRSCVSKLLLTIGLLFMIKWWKKVYKNMDYMKKGHTNDWNIQLPWLTMGYQFNKQTSLVLFSPHFLYFRFEPQLPTSISRDVAHVVNLNDCNVQIQACE